MPYYTLIPVEKKLDTISFDAVVTETYELRSQITSYPVENLERITDQIVNENIVISLNCEITNTPLNLNEPATNKALEAFNSLTKLRNEKKPSTLITGLDRFENMCIINISINRDKSTSQMLKFTLQVQQINVATSQITNGNAVLGGDGNTINQFSSESNLGKTVSRPIDYTAAQLNGINQVINP